MQAKLLQPYLTLCVHMDYSLPGFSVHVILQARILEWGSMPSSEDLSDLGIKLPCLTSPALAGRVLPLAPPGKPWIIQ